MKFKMQLKIAMLTAILLFATSCGAKPDSEDGNSESGEMTQEAKENFYYQETSWGMSMDDVIKQKGAPDKRSDEPEELEEEDAEAEQNPEGYVDLYYEGKKVLEDYTAVEQYMFTPEEGLQGVINILDSSDIVGEISAPEEAKEAMKAAYLDLKDKLTALYGEPAAEFTAHGTEKITTIEELDLDKENAVVCATRWDGNNYRFIYIMYFFNDMTLDVRYISHPKEQVDSANS